jgi:hypothetical protein
MASALDTGDMEFGVVMSRSRNQGVARPDQPHSSVGGVVVECEVVAAKPTTGQVIYLSEAPPNKRRKRRVTAIAAAAGCELKQREKRVRGVPGLVK